MRTFSRADSFFDRRPKWTFGLVAVGTYLVLSLFTWSHLIAAGIGSNLHELSIGDPGMGVFYMGWLPYALGHGLNPFHSGFMFAPQGINTLSNTSFLLEALLLSPITVLWGPVASFNIACVLAPVVSAAAMYFALRRFSLGRIAGLVGGAAYGFAPVILQGDVVGHFNLTWMFFPPLLILLAERVLHRQEGSPIRYGFLLGGLVILEFFNSLEVLIDCVVLMIAALVVVGVIWWRKVPSRAPFALKVVGVAALIDGIVLAYPIWYYFAGPDHVPYVNSSFHSGLALTSAVWPSLETARNQFITAPIGTPWLLRFDGGFVGPIIFLLAIAAVGVARRRGIAIVLLASAAISYVFSLGLSFRLDPNSSGTGRTPFYFVTRVVPLLRDINPARFALLTDALLVILAAFTLDEVVRVLRSRSVSEWVAAAVVVPICLLAIVPLLIASEVPFGQFGIVSAPAVLSDIPAGPSGPPIAWVYPSGGIFDGVPLAQQSLAGFTWRNWTGYSWHLLPGNNSAGVVVVGSSVVQYITVYAPTTSTSLILSSAHQQQIRDSVRSLGITCIVVLNGAPGSVALDHIFPQVYGPGRPEPGGTIWVLSGLTTSSRH
jgi:hypothetical protein